VQGALDVAEKASPEMQIEFVAHLGSRFATPNH
jgi:hypothetical protein